MIKEIRLIYNTETWEFVVDANSLHDVEVLGFIETAKVAVTRRMEEGGNHASTSTGESTSNSDGINTVS